MRAAQAGNGAALTQVFRRHWALTLAVSTRVLGVKQEAEDVAQIALTKAFMELGTLEDPAAFKAWLCTIATRMAFHRRRQIHTEAKLQQQIMAECSCHPELHVSSSESFYSLESSTWLDCLREEERTIFLLRHINSLELSRIAMLTGRSIATVKRRLRDARDRLSVLAQRGSA